MNRSIGAISLACLVLPSGGRAVAQGPTAATVRRVEVAERPDGRRLTGRLSGDPSNGFRFEPDGGGAPIALQELARLVFEGPATEPGAKVDAPFQVELGRDQRISGRLGAVDEATIRLEEGPGGRPVIIRRDAAVALRQRPGEVQALREGFETLDPARWRVVGEPETVAEPLREGLKALRLAAGGASVTCRLAEPVGSGRLDLAFFVDEAALAPRAGQRWFVDLMFRAQSGDEAIQALLGWGDEAPGVVSRGGPALRVQRLVLTPGWHTLAVRFHPERTLLIVDGNELAVGQGPGGPLAEIRLATEALDRDDPPAGLAAIVDDLRLARFVEPTGTVEVDPSQDEVRLASGDQLFGRLRSAGPDGLVLKVDGRPASLSWAEVAGASFRRGPATSARLEGDFVRVEWRQAADAPPDRLEGVIVALDDASLALLTPYCGELAIPRDRLVSVTPLGRAARIVLDPHAHHLGDQLMPELDPPQPDGPSLEIAFTLEDETAEAGATLLIDAVEVAGAAEGLPFAPKLKEGELRTDLTINGRAFDTLNRHVATRNESPERLRVPVPAGLLKRGPNTLKFVLVGSKDDPDYLDDLGILGVQLELGPGGPP